MKSGNTRPSSLFRMNPRVDLMWLKDDLFIKGTKEEEIFYDRNRVRDRFTVQTSRVRLTKEIYDNIR